MVSNWSNFPCLRFFVKNSFMGYFDEWELNKMVVEILCLLLRLLCYKWKLFIVEGAFSTALVEQTMQVSGLVRYLTFSNDNLWRLDFSLLSTATYRLKTLAFWIHQEFIIWTLESMYSYLASQLFCWYDLIRKVKAI